MNRTSSALGRSALCLLALSGLAQGARADIHSWNTGNGNWSTGTNWSPVGMPFPLDVARIGDLPGIDNATVTLNVNATVTAATIQNGMTLRTMGNTFGVLGTTTISGQNTVSQTLFPSTLRVQTGGFAYGFSTNDLSINTGGRLLVENNSMVEVTNQAMIDAASSLVGHGDIAFKRTSAEALVNNGTIRPTPGGLILRSSQAGRLDLDGSNGNGILDIDTQDGTGLMIVDQGLYDAFSGEIHLTSNSELTMSMAEPWTADINSLISAEGIIDIEPRPPAVLVGGLLTIAGDIDVGGFAGHLRVVGATTLASTAQATVGTEDKLVFTGATVEGGTYTLADGAALDFDGPAFMHGGTFTTPSQNYADGMVRFLGPTHWNGTVTFNGVASQDGDAEVEGETVITAGVFNFDGDGATTWDINHRLTINANSIENLGFPPERFQGTLNIAGGTVARLTVNLPAGTSWIMDGVLNLDSGTTLIEERLIGSPVVITGDVQVDTGKVRIWADTTFGTTLGGAQVHLVTGTTTLYMAGQTVVESGAVFTGLGTLQTTTIGTMTLADGASLGPVGLVNQGVLQVGAGAATASVDRFQNATQGTWRVSIGGATPGTQHDVLIVSGGSATLAGNIDVVLENGFHPSIGQQFTVLTTLSGVSGTFAANPVTQTPAGTYNWTVLYNPNNVVLKLTGFTPTDCYANCDGSTVAPILNVADFTCFLNKFMGGSTWANCDGSTVAPVLNVSDFTCFLNKFNAGCS